MDKKDQRTGPVNVPAADFAEAKDDLDWLSTNPQVLDEWRMRLEAARQFETELPKPYWWLYDEEEQEALGIRQEVEEWRAKHGAAAEEVARDLDAEKHPEEWARVEEQWRERLTRDDPLEWLIPGTLAGGEYEAIQIEPKDEETNEGQE